jgi:hypothetical protein
MDEDDGGWGENSDFSEEQDVQDDDDTSWKVRRGGCRVISSIILTRPELHGFIIADYSLKLADRFKERSDDVKIELLDAFRLLVQSETHSQSLNQFLGKIVSSLIKQSKNKNIKVRIATLSVLAALAQALQ